MKSFQITNVYIPNITILQESKDFNEIENINVLKNKLYKIKSQLDDIYTSNNKRHAKSIMKSFDPFKSEKFYYYQSN